jgi:ABC-type multidrug transport system fused ATPase/permease subunit
MDLLMVLEQGKIKAYGTVKELLKTENQFSKAYQHVGSLN